MESSPIGTGYITVQGSFGGQPMTLELRYTDVYAWRRGTGSSSTGSRLGGISAALAPHDQA